MSAAVVRRLLAMRVVAVDELTREDERFRCVPLRAVLSAKACIARQDAHGTWVRAGNWGDYKVKPGTPGSQKVDMGSCADCELGRRVRAKVGA